MTATFRPLHRLLFALAVLASIPAWANPVESVQCVDSAFPEDEPRPDLSNALTGSDSNSADTPCLGIDNPFPHPPLSLSGSDLAPRHFADLIPVNHLWSYWPQAPPDPVIV